MHIEQTSISCGVRRLIIPSSEEPSQSQLETLIKANKGHCAMVIAGVPTRRQKIMTLLLENGFEQVKEPKRAMVSPNDSISSTFIDIASLIMTHGEGQMIIDNALESERFIETTVNSLLTDVAALVRHHGNELVGNINFFVRCI